MELVVTTLVNWLAISSMYILVALGFAFLVSILGILNLAHGVIYMMGGYIAYQLAVLWGINVWLALLLAALVVGAFGLFLEKFCFRPFVGDMNRIIVVCIAISVIHSDLGQPRHRHSRPEGAGLCRRLPQPRTHNGECGEGGDLRHRGHLLAATMWFVNKTKPGQQMLAVGQNRVGAVLQGIHVNRISGLATVIACALAAVAGCLMAAYLNLNAFMGDYILLKAIIIVILGGLGSIGGVFFSGLVLGAIDATVPVFISGAASEAISLAIIVVILIFRPQGFFGRDLVEEETHSYQESGAFSYRPGNRLKIGLLGRLGGCSASAAACGHEGLPAHVFVLTLIYMIAAASLR